MASDRLPEKHPGLAAKTIIKNRKTSQIALYYKKSILRFLKVKVEQNVNSWGNTQYSLAQNGCPDWKRMK